MAFTQEERYRMLIALGWSVFEDDGPAMRAINSLDSREAAVRPFIMPILDRIDQLQDELMNTLPLLKAIQTDDIQLRGTTVTIPGIQELGRIQIAKLARMIKVRPCPDGDIFSSKLPGEDFYSGDPSEPRINPSMGTYTTGGGKPEW